jgi:ATP-dependent helicase/nuclease subunit B
VTWQLWAREAASWLAAQGVEARSALVTVPVGALLAPARQAWVQAVGGWLPRIETIASLAQSRSWSRATVALDEAGAEAFGAALSLDGVEDRLQAARCLGRQPWARQWAARDRRGYEFALEQVVDAAHTWVRALQATPPLARAERVAGWRQVLQDQWGTGPGGRERLLLAWALEWAAASASLGLPMDAVFDERPAAWLAVSVGLTVLPGSEGELTQVAMGLAGAAGVPARWWAAQVSDLSECSGEPHVALSIGACHDLLDEARRAAAQVVKSVSTRPQGADAVGLIALDRSVVRHARALLDGSGLNIADETGWLLSTTRAAAACSRLLVASSPRASTDELLDGLKSAWVQTSAPDDLFAEDPAVAIGLLERWCRRHGWLSAWSPLPSPPAQGASQTQGTGAHHPGLVMPEEARALWHWAHEALAPLRGLWTANRPTLKQWLTGLRETLVRCRTDVALKADAAGELLWSTLRLDALDEGGDKLPESHRTARMDGAAFQRWLADTLEAVTFRPEGGGARPDVVITTMARAALRPFHEVVMPGADERQLGALGPPAGWLGVRLREAMGLATPTLARQAQWEAFCLVSTRPVLHALHRQAEGSEPLEASPWLSRLLNAGAAVAAPNVEPREQQVQDAQPVRSPAPVMGARGLVLPGQLSATQHEVLRQCPYRFFAQVVLRLQPQEELEEGLARSDHGSWLHEVLRAFHEARDRRLARATPEADEALWLQVAREAAEHAGLLSEGMRAHFRPHELALPELAKAYVGWLHRHEGEGWRVQACELNRERLMDLSDAAPGLRLRLIGQLDRVDVRASAVSDGAQEAMVIDYKTGSAAPLKKKVKAGAEDTQLAFYAALTDAPSSGSLQAAYVHIDHRKVDTLVHPDIEDSAQALIDQLSEDWVRMHLGTPLLALGDGAACEHCAMRGLCRKDHWSHEEGAPR